MQQENRIIEKHKILVLLMPFLNFTFMKKKSILKEFKRSKIKISNLSILSKINGGSTDNHGETGTTYATYGCNGTLMSC